MFIVYIQHKADLLYLKHVVLSQMKQYGFASWKTYFTQLEALLQALEAAEDTDELDPEPQDWLKPKLYKPVEEFEKPTLSKRLLQKLSRKKQ